MDYQSHIINLSGDKKSEPPFSFSDFSFENNTYNSIWCEYENTDGDRFRIEYELSPTSCIYDSKRSISRFDMGFQSVKIKPKVHVFIRDESGWKRILHPESNIVPPVID